MRTTGFQIIIFWMLVIVTLEEKTYLRPHRLLPRDSRLPNQEALDESFAQYQGLDIYDQMTLLRIQTISLQESYGYHSSFTWPIALREFLAFENTITPAFLEFQEMVHAQLFLLHAIQQVTNNLVNFGFPQQIPYNPNRQRKALWFYHIISFSFQPESFRDFLLERLRNIYRILNRIDPRINVPPQIRDGKNELENWFPRLQTPISSALSLSRLHLPDLEQLPPRFPYTDTEFYQFFGLINDLCTLIDVMEAFAFWERIRNNLLSQRVEYFYRYYS